MKHKFLYLLMLMTGFSSTAICQQQSQQQTQQQPARNTEQEEKAKEAGAAWLKLLDQQSYDQSWDASAATMKLLIPKNDWKNLMVSLRKPLGLVNSRTLIEELPAKDPHGLPKGDYMVLVYSTSFSGKANAHELITMQLESTGQWRVLTYQVN